MMDGIDIPIDAEARAKFREVGVMLNDHQAKDLQEELENCACERAAELAMRPSADLKKHRQKIMKHAQKLVECFGDYLRESSRSSEPFNEAIASYDAILLDSADVKSLPNNLLGLLDWVKKDLYRSSGGAPSNVFQGSFLTSLAAKFCACTGKSASTAPDSSFIKFVCVANDLLPRRLQYTRSAKAFATAWERHLKRYPTDAPKKG